MSHYFVEDKNLKSDIKNIEYTFKGKNLKLISDSGVFSRDRVDFGTNVLLNSLIIKGNRILDVGCGYGIIGISVASSDRDLEVEMIDVNDSAVTLAKINANNNKLSNIKIYKSNMYEEVSGKFDMIISNPPIRAGKAVVHGIVERGKNYLNKLGSIWVVIQKKQGASSLFEKMNNIFGNCEIVDKRNGYLILMSINQ